MTVICDYCKAPADLVAGREIYPHIPKLWANAIYRCLPCKARVGCHPGTTKPLGRLANAELRAAKMAAHAAFDPLWKGGEMKRKDAYRALASALGVRFEDCHIGMFDVPMCARVVAAIPRIKRCNYPGCATPTTPEPCDFAACPRK